MPKIKIEKLYTSEVKTKYGLKQKLSVYNDKGVRFDAWQSEWTKDWKIGGEIDVTEDQAEKREYNGKVYYQLKAPQNNFKGPGGGGNSIVIDKLNEILKNQEKILHLLSAKSGVATPLANGDTTPPAHEPPEFSLDEF